MISEKDREETRRRFWKAAARLKEQAENAHPVPPGTAQMSSFAVDAPEVHKSLKKKLADGNSDS